METWHFKSPQIESIENSVTVCDGNITPVSVEYDLFTIRISNYYSRGNRTAQKDGIRKKMLSLWIL